MKGRVIHSTCRGSPTRMLAVCLLLLFWTTVSARAEDTITILTDPVRLNPFAPEIDRVGALTYRGGLALRSDDDRFGGLSDMQVSRDGSHMLVVTDRGNWLRAGLEYDQAGRLTGAGPAQMGPLVNEQGEPVQYRYRDSESMTQLPDGSILVGFERNHRLLLYPAADPPFSARPRLFPKPLQLDQAPDNGGLEALAHVGSGYIVGLAERLRATGGTSAAWVGRNGNWNTFGYVHGRGFQPTAATLLENGDLLVLERKFTLGTGVAVRMVRVPRNAIAPGRRVAGTVVGEFGSPFTIDNFEAVSARPGAEGETLVYILSDDNFNPLQRTLLMMFEITD